MAWETRTVIGKRLGSMYSFPGEKPTTSIRIENLIRYLENARDAGEEIVNLDGLGTLHIRGEVLMATEPQI